MLASLLPATPFVPQAMLPCRLALRSATSSLRASNTNLSYRTMSSSAGSSLAGVVVGVDTNGASTAKNVDVSAQWKASRASSSRSNELRVFYPDNGTPVAAVSLGEQKAAPTTTPDLTPSEKVYLRNEQLERVRLAAAKGVKAIRDLGAGPDDKGDVPVERIVALDAMSSPHAAAAGANLGLWSVNHSRPEARTTLLTARIAAIQGGKEIKVVPVDGAADESAKKQLKDAGDDVPSVAPLSWYTGEVYAEAQNWARELKETPANLMTPTIFGQRVTAAFKNVPNTTVIVPRRGLGRATSA